MDTLHKSVFKRLGTFDCCVGCCVEIDGGVTFCDPVAVGGGQVDGGAVYGGDMLMTIYIFIKVLKISKYILKCTEAVL
jgi:hypothetical protein